MTAGLASASFCWIARAASYDASASAGLPVSLSRMPMLLWLLARSLWNSVTAGLASASFCWIASAASYDASASAGLPVSLSRTPMLLWLVARSLWNWVTAGLASASFCWIARAAWYDASASAGLPVSLSRMPMLLWLRQVALELGDGGVGVGQLLLDRPRRLVRRQRLGRLAGLAQQDADVVVATRQVALELGDGGVGAGQALQQRSSFLVRRPRLVRPPGLLQEIAQVDQAARRRSAFASPSASARFGQPPAHRQRLPVAGDRLLRRADLARQLGQLGVRLPQRPPRTPVGLARELALQPLVELGRVLQQPVAHRLEVVVLEQDVLADPGVERLDRLQRQVEPGCTWRWPRQVGVGLRLRGRLGEQAVGLRSSALARACTARTAASPTSRHHQRRRRGRHRRPLPPHPPPRPLGQRLGPGRTGSSAIHRSTSSASAAAVA